MLFIIFQQQILEKNKNREKKKRNEKIFIMIQKCKMHHYFLEIYQRTKKW